jgi:hypothetical protein
VKLSNSANLYLQHKQANSYSTITNSKTPANVYKKSKKFLTIKIAPVKYLATTLEVDTKSEHGRRRLQWQLCQYDHQSRKQEKV